MKIKGVQNAEGPSNKLKQAITIQEHRDVSVRFVEFDIQLILKRWLILRKSGKPPLKHTIPE